MCPSSVCLIPPPKKKTGSKMVGIFVLLTQFIHIVLMVDFFYYYIISVRSGLPMQLPRAGGLV